MKNKKGLTLIILLIVTSLTIISIPNIIKIYENNKEKTFSKEIALIKKEISKKYINNSLSGAELNEVFSSFGEDTIDYIKNQFEYYAELDMDGTIQELYVSNGELEYEYNLLTGKEIIKEANITNENKLDFIKDTLENNKIEVYEDSHSIYSYNDTIPVIISNNTNQNINVNIAHGSYILTTNFEIKANTDKYLIPVHIPKKVLDTLKKDTLYGLKVNIISPIKTSYSDKIKFKIVKQDVIISNVITSKGSRVAFSQMDIFSYNPINSEEIIVTLKNNSKKTYKITNINEYELNNNLFSQEIINLSVEYELDDIYIYPNEEKNIKFKYILNSNDNQHNINKIEILSDIYNNLDSLNITE